jgi:hypothetical protein
MVLSNNYSVTQLTAITMNLIYFFTGTLPAQFEAWGNLQSFRIEQNSLQGKSRNDPLKLCDVAMGVLPSKLHARLRIL